MPLSGFTVVELGSLPAVAYCGKLFADFRADVVKVEPPGGDPGRRLAPLVDIGTGRQESGYFGFLNTNKRSVTVDAADPAQLAALRRLLRRADVVLDGLGAAERAAFGVDHAALRAERPALVLLDVSWFGKTGPYRDFQATDAVVRALAGLVQLVGPQAGPPLALPDYQAGIVGGLASFIAALASLQAADPGRAIELSVHEACVALAEYQAAQAAAANAAQQRWGINRFSPTYPLGIYRCREGWIGITVVTPAQWKAFCRLLGLEDLIDDPRCVTNMDRLTHADELEARFKPRFLDRTAAEWFAVALERRLPFAIVPNMAEALTLEVHRARGAFVPVQHGGRSYQAPGSPLRLTATPAQPGGRVPAAGEHNALLRADEQAAGGAVTATRDTGKAPAEAVKALPLQGVRVVDLSMGWAGPLCTRQMADLGAEVIKIEACQYPDWWRGVDNRPIVIEQVLYEKSAWFNVMNRNKHGVTLDLTEPEGVTLLKALVTEADAVVENYSAGVLPKLGLDYAALRDINPALVMMSMPAFGGTGPWSGARAYGSTLEHASGLPSVAGPADGPPVMSHIAYGDAVSGLNAAAALLVALLHKKRTGQGQHIDLSQVECMLPMAAAWLVEQSANGAVRPRLGNRHPTQVPHGSFRCRGDDAWLLVAVTDDAMWQRLCAAIGRADLAADAGLASLAGRRRREDEIEAAVGAWTARYEIDAAMLALQAAGVAAGAVRSPFGLTADPHLLARGFWQPVERAFVGRHLQPSPPYREGGAPYPIQGPAPTLGQHNVEVLTRVLGLTPARLAALRAAGIIGTEAVPPAQRKARAAVG